LRAGLANLNQIKKPVEQELAIFEKKFRQAMKSRVALVDRVMYYIVQRKGKQMRPMFVFLSARICGNITEATYTAASLIELLHTATLVHDDVVDDAYERRGFFSINALWKNKIAVLIGDYLLAKGLLISLETNQHRLLKITSNAVQEMSEGELLQIEKKRKMVLTEDDYFEIIRKKTASLIASACSAGAASTTEDEAVISKMRLFGEKVGIAFQIKDDLLDYGDDDTGKPHANDIKEGKLTLPFIYALSRVPFMKRMRMILRLKYGKKSKEVIQELIQFVKENGGISYAEQKMNEYRNDAFAILHGFPDSEYAQSLKLLVEFTTERKR
jgi:octaprenyl-diphosphate synthase